MPQPTANDLHVDTLLTQVSLAYMNEPGSYIMPSLFPVIAVNKQSDIIAEYNKDFWFRDEAKVRAPGTESDGGGFAVTKTKTYFCNNYAWHEDVADEDRRNYDSPFDPDADATALVTEKLRLREEISGSGALFTTGVWGTSGSTDLTGGTDFTKWSDYGASDPITDIDITARESIFSVTGKDPRTFAMGRSVWMILKHHPDLLERIKYTQRGLISKDLFAALLDLDEILVAQSIKATAAEGATSQTYSYIVGKVALLLYKPTRPGLRVPSAGYTFRWKVFGSEVAMFRIRMDARHADRIEGQIYFDHKQLATDCGVFMTTVVA